MGEGGEKLRRLPRRRGRARRQSLDTSTDETQPGKVEDEIARTQEGAARPTTTLTWQDILVVPRKPFLKGGRLELAPFTGITINDNLIRHYVFGADLSYFLTDAIWIGVQGQYFVKQLSSKRARRPAVQPASTLNRYLYGGSFNFGYVPAYGKFALVNSTIVHWEIWASAGFGVTFTEVIARDPASVQGVQEHGAHPERRHRHALLPARLVDGQPRGSRLHHSGQVRAASGDYPNAATH